MRQDSAGKKWIFDNLWYAYAASLTLLPIEKLQHQTVIVQNFLIANLQRCKRSIRVVVSFQKCAT